MLCPRQAVDFFTDGNSDDLNGQVGQVGQVSSLRVTWLWWDTICRSKLQTGHLHSTSRKQLCKKAFD